MSKATKQPGEVRVKVTARNPHKPDKRKRPMREHNRELMAFRLPNELVDSLRERCELDHCSQTSVVERALIAFLGKGEQQG